MKNDLKYALDRNNTTAGKLSDVLGIVKKRDARIAELEAENAILTRAIEAAREIRPHLYLYMFGKNHADEIALRLAEFDIANAELQKG